jgi:rhamnosyltransferase subunit B
MTASSPTYKFIFNPMGSAGDVHPYLGVAVELLARGHEVIVLSNGSFQSTAQQLNIPFIPVGDVVDWKTVGKDQKLRKQGSAWKESIGWASYLPMRQTYELIKQHNEPSRTCIASPMWSFGAKLASEKHNIPHVNFIINSLVLRSLHDTPETPQMYFPEWMPRWMKWYEYFWADVLFIDPVLARPLNAFRRELGLPRVFRVMNRWWFGKDKALGLFYSFMTPTQRDWKVDVKHVGHTLWDPIGDSEVTKQAIEFCKAETAPVIFVPGSIGPGDASFFTSALEACRRLGNRAIFLDRNHEFIPKPLPTWASHFEYVPLKEIMPLCTAAVHSGCAGTLHHALAAGIGHVVWPRVNDQPDNARRLMRLGIGERIQTPDVDSLANSIAKVTTNVTVSAKAREYASIVKSSNAISTICDELEELMQGVDQRCQSSTR